MHWNTHFIQGLRSEKELLLDQDTPQQEAEPGQASELILKLKGSENSKCGGSFTAEKALQCIETPTPFSTRGSSGNHLGTSRLPCYVCFHKYQKYKSVELGSEMDICTKAFTALLQANSNISAKFCKSRDMCKSSRRWNISLSKVQIRLLKQIYQDQQEDFNGWIGYRAIGDRHISVTWI